MGPKKTSLLAISSMLLSLGHAQWALSGNAGTSPSSNFIGTTDNQGLVFRVGNVQSGLLGTAGANNTSWGNGALFAGSSGYYNTATGAYALAANTSGAVNTAHGVFSLQQNTTGYSNTALGTWALANNTAGNYNTAVGGQSLYNNTIGNNNTATGTGSMYQNTEGHDNTANGYQSMSRNSTGSNNTAMGTGSLYNNYTGSNNTALGNGSLFFAGYYDFAGVHAENNTAVGGNAMSQHNVGNNNTAVGYQALVTDQQGNNNTAIGAGADVSYPFFTNATAIGANAIVGMSNALVLGNAVNVGMGTSYPSFRATVAQDMAMNDNVDAAQFAITGASDAGKRMVFGYETNGNGFGFIKAGYYQHTWTNLALQPNGGNVLIGKTGQANNNYRLDVAGPVRANKLTVNTDGADFVFEPSYRLRPLGEVEAYVKQNRHLPDIAPAAVMQRDGMEIGEAQTNLLQKVEELTLYIITQDKRLEAQDRVVGEQAKLLYELQKKINALEERSKHP